MRRTAASVSILIAMVCVLPAAEASQNLASNPGFENGTGAHVVDWREYTYGTKGGRLEVVNDPAQAHSGNKCLCLDSRRGYSCAMQGWGAAWDPGVYPGKRQQYLMKVYAKCLSQDPGRRTSEPAASDSSGIGSKGLSRKLLMQLCTYGAKGERPKAAPKDFKTEFRFPVTTEWQEYVQPITVPEGTTHLNLIVGGAAGNQGLLYVDDVGLYDAREAQIRFLPSKEQVVVVTDPTYLRWAKHLAADAKLSAEVAVYAKNNNAAPVAKEAFAIGSGRTVLRLSTEALPEGDYTVQVVVRNSAGEELGREDDWFEKRVFDWMKHPRGIGPEVPAPYVALEAKDREVRPWGRRYAFNKLGLLECVQSQGDQWLQGEMELLLTVDGNPLGPLPEPSGATGSERLQPGFRDRPLEWKAVEPFRLTDVQPASVRGQACLVAGNLKVRVDAVTEYDGLVRYRLTYGPANGQTTIHRLRLRAPLNASLCRFYSADGAERHWDPQSKDLERGYAHDLLPTTQGKVFDSLERPQPGKLPQTFTGLFWLADHETCFCYAADNDEGWLLRDDAPSVEAVREGADLVLWLNLVDRPALLRKPRILEFAFQAGPTKPLPEGWRGIQNGGDPDDAPLTFNLIREAGSGYTLCGDTHFIHPGDTAEQRQRSKERIEKAIAGGRRAAGGYHFWGHVAKGFPETRVFRSEWGIDKDAWKAHSTPRPWEWNGRFFGENPDLCILLRANTVPSYVDFLTYAYDEALKCTELSGFYDDTGYLKKVFDEDLGIGYTREDGVKIASSGLWTYRDRWKRVAYVHHKYRRPNYTWDSQHVHAHHLPAHNFIGIWAPCEKGYYNTFKDRDILDYYGSIERYAAFNPAKQFGQPAMVGMSSHRGRADQFGSDTRTMMMLALLHDQDVGSFGERDLRMVCRLRHARNLFQPWEKDVGFAGYWNNADWVRCPQADVRVSLFHRPDAALLVVGNVGAVPAEAVLVPAWNRWKPAAATMTAVDAETGERIAMEPGPAGPTIKLRVPRHDVRLVLVAPQGRFQVTTPTLGAELPGPATILAQFSDRFVNIELASAWQKDLHEGTSWAGILDGRLCVQGNSYGYAHVRRELGVDDVSVQCLIMRPPGGGMDAWGAGLFLVWPNGRYVQASPGMAVGKFFYLFSGGGHRYGSPVSKQPVAGWFPYCANWVKLCLSPEWVEGFGSSDGKTWSKDWKIKRGDSHAGPPRWVMLGNGSPGKEPLLNNVHPQHFSPKNPSTAFFSDLIVGRQ